MKKITYILYDEGLFAGYYYAEEISQITGLPSRMVSHYAESGLLYHKRYTVEKLQENILPENVEKWAQEWNQVRQQVLAALTAVKIKKMENIKITKY